MVSGENINILIDNLCKTINNNYQIYPNNLLIDYLINTCKNIFETHTFYHRKEKVNFLDFYYPLSCKLEGKEVLFKSPVKELREHKFILIEGTAGSGKTSVMKYLFIKTIEEGERIPVFIQLRHLNDMIDGSRGLYGEIRTFTFTDYEGGIKTVNKEVPPNLIENYFYSLLSQSNEQDEVSEINNRALFKQLLGAGLFLIILDGYDEIYTASQSSLINQLSNFQNRYCDNYFIITSRPGTIIQRLAKVKKVTISNLSSEDVEAFITMLNEDKNRADNIIKSLENKKSIYYKELLTNPLLLTMFVLTYESYPEIPKKRSEFYRNVFNTLYAIHKTSQGIMETERKTGFDCSEFEKAMAAISYISYLQGMYSFHETQLFNIISDIRKSGIIGVSFKEEDLLYDLITSISILVQDGVMIFYPHRSIQEYFVSLFFQQINEETLKKRAYDRLRYEIIESSTDDLCNIYDLLIELDPSGLKNYFIIGVLNDFYKIIDIPFSELIEKFLKECDYTVHLFYEEDSYNDVIVEIFREEPPILSALNYMGFNTILSKIDKCINITEIKRIIKDVIINDEDVFDEVFRKYESTNDIATSLIDLCSMSCAIEDVVFEYLRSVELENTFFSKIKSEMEDIKAQIKYENDGLGEIIDFK